MKAMIDYGCTLRSPVRRADALTALNFMDVSSALVASTPVSIPEIGYEYEYRLVSPTPFVYPASTYRAIIVYSFMVISS